MHAARLEAALRSGAWRVIEDAAREADEAAMRLGRQMGGLGG